MPTQSQKYQCFTSLRFRFPLYRSSPRYPLLILYGLEPKPDDSWPLAVGSWDRLWPFCGLHYYCGRGHA